MLLRHKRDKEPDLNITPLIDVVFLLLIFFMVSTTFEKESEISIELPDASGKPVKKEEFTIEVTIDAQGRYFVNQRRVKDTSIVTLKQAVSVVRGSHKDPQYIISADRNTPHQAVVKAMDAARQLGLYKLTFATKQADEEK
ncbi:MAG: biopolymer transporter ExbD [Gammaproteobacteria bacterium]|jgi:biopolymer transport protein ExbD